MKRRPYTLLLLSPLVLCSLEPRARGAEPPPVISVVREMIKEGRMSAHEKVESDWAKAVRKARLSAHYVALQSMSGPGEVWFLMAYPSFEGVQKSVDEIEKVAAVRGEMEMLDSRDGELRSGSRNLYAVYRKDLSFKPDLVPVSRMRYVMVGSYRVKLGKTMDFTEGSKAVVAAHEKINANEEFLCYEVIAGAPEGLFLIFTPMESLKQMDEYPEHERQFADAMGKEALAKLMKGTGEVFSSIENSIFEVNPRMSYVSKETEDGDPAFWRPKPPAAKPTAEPKPKSGM